MRCPCAGLHRLGEAPGEPVRSPAAWLTRQRVEHARLLLETTDLSVDEVARRAGFGTAVSLRAHLRAAVGVAPLAYRRTFRPAVEGAPWPSNSAS